MGIDEYNYLQDDIPLIFYASFELQESNLETAMALITNAYISSDDIVRAIEQYNIDQRTFSDTSHKKIATAFETFVTDHVLVNSSVEEGLSNLARRINNKYFKKWIDALILCHHDRNLKFALQPIIDEMNDAKLRRMRNDTAMKITWRVYIATLALLFSIIPIFRFLNDTWFIILTRTLQGRFCLVLMILSALGTAFYLFDKTKKFA